MARRLMFLWYILNEDESCLLSRFFRAQESSTCKGDWMNSISEDLDYLEIYLTLDQIKNSLMEKFKLTVL